MFLFSYSFKSTVWKNPTQDRRATNSISTPPAPPRHPTAPSPSPHPPYPPPTAATSSLSNRYWFNNYENISSCLNISTGVYTGPLYDMWNLSTWKRKDDTKRTLLNIVWLINPPNWWAVYSATVDAPDGGNITGKSHYHRATKEDNQHQEQDGQPKNIQETSLQIQMKNFIILIQFCLFNLYVRRAKMNGWINN